MPVYRFQTTIRTADNNAANYATNTTYWDCTGTTEAEEVILDLKGSYDIWQPEMSNLAVQNGHVVKVYDMADPEPRAPVIETTFNLASAPTGTPLPPEVSLCVSFQAPKISGIAQARRRGRNYLPFPSTAAAGTDGRPDAGAVAAGTSFGQNLLDFSNSGSGHTWCVYSQLVEGNISIVENGWCDNEWDTQRRRGRVATSRSIFS